MSKYDDYINRMCRTGTYKPERARETVISRGVEKYYREDADQETVNSIHTPLGECK